MSTADAQPPPEPAETPGPPLGDPAVVAVDIGKRFGDRDVVQGLSFEVQRGTIFGIIGPSGCGKTTTIRMLLGVLRPTSGDLRVLGRQPHRSAGATASGWAICRSSSSSSPSSR